MNDDYDFDFNGDLDALAEEIQFAIEDGDEEYAKQLRAIYENAMRFEVYGDGYNY